MQLPTYLASLLILAGFSPNASISSEPPAHQLGALPLPTSSPIPAELRPNHGHSFSHSHGSHHAHLHAAHKASRPRPLRLQQPQRRAAWISLGCVSDGPARALPAYASTQSDMTVELCQSSCLAAGYSYAGVEYGSECHCDHSLQNGLGTSIDSSQCTMPCSGNNAETCGGNYAMDLYQVSQATTSPSGSWKAAGCVTDGDARALTGISTTSSTNTAESCQALCQANGYTYAGTEYGDECYCGDSLSNGLGQTAPAGDCNVACAGSSSETCGGSWRLSLYTYTPASSSTPTTTSTGPTSTGSASAPAGSQWVSLGCVSDGPDRALPAYQANDPGMTIELCQSTCSKLGYSLAGLEYSDECHCDNSLKNGLGAPAQAAQCQMACAGNGKELCGGSYAMNLYQLQPVTGTTTTSTSTTSTSTAAPTGGWSSMGCAVDQATRVLGGTSTSSTSMTVETCAAFCKGYTYMGVENGNECYCSNSLTGGFQSGTGCTTACAGNSAETCGGGWRINVYSWSASSSSSSGSSWSSLGCVTDGPARALPAYQSTDSSMTIELCQSTCLAKGYSYAGVEYGQECHCDNSLQNSLGTSTSAGSCNMVCSGNAGETCGGSYVMNLYKYAPTGTTTTTATTTSTAAPSWKSLGCAVDQNTRVLGSTMTSSTSLTLESCQAFCKGYAYMGVENGNECYCGNALTGGLVSGTGCTTPCAGNSAETCGGGWRINIYSYTTGSTTSTSTSATATATAGAQIWDIWYTRNDQSALFQRQSMSTPITFTNPGPIGQADIVVNDAQVYQQMDGFGASLTDSSASMLQNLKNANSNNYWQLLHTLFDTTDGAATAGLSILRVPLGASDFSQSVYSFHDNYDPNLGSFNINAAPSYLWSTLADIVSVNPSIKIMVAPWSPPGWMKDTGTMLGGTFNNNYASTLANYLLKSIQGFKSKGFTVTHIAVQNEPENNNPTYPTCLMNPDDEANVAAQLRQLLNSNGFGNVKIMAWEHNWDQAANYPVQAVNDEPNAFAGASFHCYAGSVDQQMSFVNAHPDKEVHFTECIGTYGSDWWSDIKWDMDNLMIGAPNYMSRSVVMWAIALDGAGNPKLPGTDSCGGAGCRPIVTVNYDGTYSLNQEFYSLAQASRAVVPKDSGGPFGQRIGATVGGNLNYELVVSAYKTGRSAAAGTDWNRYSLVVLNWNDQQNAGPVTTTIEFRGTQATYAFPIGVTTLWWFAQN